MSKCNEEWHPPNKEEQAGLNSCERKGAYWNRDWWRHKCDGEENGDEHGWFFFNLNFEELHFVSESLYNERCGSDDST